MLSSQRLRRIKYQGQVHRCINLGVGPAPRSLGSSGATHAESFRRGGTMDTNWMARGRCKDMDPALFFPSDSIGVRSAQHVCVDCTVRLPCLSFALANSINDGVWGGTSERQRRRLLRHHEGARSTLAELCRDERARQKRDVLAPPCLLCSMTLRCYVSPEHCLGAFQPACPGVGCSSCSLMGPCGLSKGHAERSGRHPRGST